MIEGGLGALPSVTIHMSYPMVLGFVILPFIPRKRSSQFLNACGIIQSVGAQAQALCCQRGLFFDYFPKGGRSR
jgi:hypothetical protein